MLVRVVWTENNWSKLYNLLIYKHNVTSKSVTQLDTTD